MDFLNNEDYEEDLESDVEESNEEDERNINDVQIKSLLENSESRYHLHDFDFEKNLKGKNGFYMILGKRNTGKTTWCRYINQFIPASKEGVVVLITMNERIKKSWSKFIPKLFIFQPEDADILSKVGKCMNNAIKSIEKKSKSSNTDRLRLTFILDDVGHETKVMNHNGLKGLAAMGRHINITVFILAQFIYQVPPRVRSQFEYIFMLSTICKKNIKAVQTEYCSHFELGSFKKILEACTQNYGLLVINTGSKSSTQTLYHAKIRNYPVVAYKMGCEAQWKISNAIYKEDDTYEDFCSLDQEKETAVSNTSNVLVVEV